MFLQVDRSCFVIQIFGNIIGNRVIEERYLNVDGGYLVKRSNFFIRNGIKIIYVGFGVEVFGEDVVSLSLVC